MNNPQSLADRYVAVWNETDPARRRQQIAELWTPSGQHYVGARAVRGHEALESRVRESHEKNVRDGGNSFRAVQDARRLHDIVVFHWEMLGAEGETVEGTGLEFLILDGEGRILVDYMFYPAYPFCELSTETVHGGHFLSSRDNGSSSSSGVISRRRGGAPA